MLRWSPDGRRIVIVGIDPSAGGNNCVMWEVDPTNGTQKKLSGRSWRQIRDAAWLPDGSGLLLAALDKSGGPTQIWAVSYPSGTDRRISNDLFDYLTVSTSADATTIVSTQQNLTSYLWLGKGDSPRDAKQVTKGRLDGLRGVAWTPHGRVVFAADHSENWDLFIADDDGANERQLTFDKRFHNNPTVCEGGRSVIYDTDFEGASHLWRLGLESGETNRLTSGLGEASAVCPGAGDRVFFVGQANNGQSHLYVMPTSGGKPERVGEWTVLPGVSAASADGRHVAFGLVKRDGTEPFKVISSETFASEGELSVPPTLDSTSSCVSWTPDGRSLVLADNRSGASNLWAFPISRVGDPKQLTFFDSGRIDNCELSFDGKRMAIARGSRVTDAVLLREAK
jgi:Tol biopolymer transport system component